jgi:GTP-binding protein Era
VTETKKCGTVGLIGRPNVGKSSLLNAILGQKIAATTHKPQTTRRRLRGIHTEGDTQLVFVDTPGIHTAKKGLHAFMVEEALEGARGVDVIALVVEPFVRRKDQQKKGERPYEMDHRDIEVLERVAKAGVETPIILVMNKMDRLRDAGAPKKLLEEWSSVHAFQDRIAVSAERKKGLKKLLAVLADLAPEGDWVFPEEMITDATERDIAAELVREKAMLELKDEIPYSLAVEIEDWDEDERDTAKGLVRIEAVIHVEREQHKGIVVGKGGERVKTIGTRARKDLEHLLGCKVFLKLFVHVEPNWTARAGMRRRFGYG